MELYLISIYILLFGWALFSIYYIIKLSKDIESVNPYIYDTIPSVFTTLGVLGTFSGIYFGLKEFDVENITVSIPFLLEGLKTAFITSIFGILLSLIFGKIAQFALGIAENKSTSISTNELGTLQKINQHLQDLNSNFTKYAENNNTHIQTQIADIQRDNKSRNNTLENIQVALGQDEKTGLFGELRQVRIVQHKSMKETREYVDEVLRSMKGNNDSILERVDGFSELLAKNNTELLVEVMKKATNEFNAQMSTLINKLVKENFQELNTSVQRMNQWQQQNKVMISEMTKQFEVVSGKFERTSSAIEMITNSTAKLTNENSHLTKLIKALQEVMIDDTKYQEITKQLTSTINRLENNTVAFDKSTNKLNDWVRNQMNFSDSVAKLLARLEEIDRIKDINELFWKNTKKQLNEGVSIISTVNKELAGDIENINEEFYGRLNDTFQNLDELIRRIITNYK